MRDADMKEFFALLDDVAGFYEKPLSPTQKAMYFRALAEFPLAEVRAGFDAHFRCDKHGDFMPKPNRIRAHITGLVAEDRRPGAEEAWAVAIGAADESKTLVWTAEMAEAWGVCRAVFASGDEIGARMAFREAYIRLVDEARRARRPAAWVTSLGHDAQQRSAAIDKAVELGRLPALERPALPAPEQSLQLLADKAPDGVRERLRGLRNWFAGRQEGPSYDAVAKQRTADAKAEAAARVAAYQQQGAA
ncbi:hypothetical protein [Caldimonas tepidiphila]|uniref:hypothetical protein n=1 Tax=Caldimonas tepidiphila TaxID=2315841 RepID=UPI001300AED9|nr:hypothetical protein [Caldimonas tepidiphila]